MQSPDVHANACVPLLALGLNELSVIVAMLAMGVMEMPIDQVIDVIPVGHGLVATIGAMDVGSIMATAGMIGCALLRVGLVDFKSMLVHVVTMRMMQMPVMKVVNVAIVPNGHMTAVGAMLVVMVLVLFAAHLRFPPHWRVRARL